MRFFTVGRCSWPGAVVHLEVPLLLHRAFKSWRLSSISADLMPLLYKGDNCRAGFEIFSFVKTKTFCNVYTVDNAWGSIWSNIIPISKDNASMVLIQFRSDVILITAMGSSHNRAPVDCSKRYLGITAAAAGISGRWWWRLGRWSFGGLGGGGTWA